MLLKVPFLGEMSIFWYILSSYHPILAFHTLYWYQKYWYVSCLITDEILMHFNIWLISYDYYDLSFLLWFIVFFGCYTTFWATFCVDITCFDIYYVDIRKETIMAEFCSSLWHGWRDILILVYLVKYGVFEYFWIFGHLCIILFCSKVIAWPL